jgi:hypothetical protein
MKHLGLLIVGAVILTGLLWPTGETETPVLIKPTAHDGAVAAPADSRVIGFQTVELNAEALAALAGGPGELVLPLADGEKLTLVLEAAETTTLGGRVHRGQVKGAPESSVLLIEEAGRWAGSVDLPDGRFFTLLHAGRGKYRLEQLDLGRDPICEGEEGTEMEQSEDGSAVMARDQSGMRVDPNACTRKPTPVVPASGRVLRINLRVLPRNWAIRRPAWVHKPRPNPATNSTTNGQQTATNPANPTGSATARNPNLTPYGRGRAGFGFRLSGRGPTLPVSGGSGSGTPTGSGGSEVDLLVVYCAGVEKRYGGVAGIKSAAQLAVQQANTAYSRSGVNMTLNLVHVAPVNYQSAGNLGGDLHNITFKHKVLRAHVSDLRKKYRADLVTLVSSKDGGGVGWLLTNLKGSRRTGYNVLGAGALRGYTLAHEVGHNLGCQHARGDSGISRGLFSHGHGHRFTASKDQGRARQYRTIMAYAPGRRIGHFSNPTRRYLGQLTGADKANNAAVLNRTVGIISAYY